MEGKPEPAIAWKKGGQQVTLRPGIDVDATGTLTLTQVRTTDSGQYQCVARNALAEVSALSIVSVIGMGLYGTFYFQGGGLMSRILDSISIERIMYGCRTVWASFLLLAMEG